MHPPIPSEPGNPNRTPGSRLRVALRERPILPFIGIYDAFSAGLAARAYDALFVSGFGFAASHYGLPDIGMIAWSDLVDFVQRLRAILPVHHLLVDVDDGYGDAAMIEHLVRRLEQAGASGLIIEDQRRPRRCGHLDGKEVLPTAEYLDKLAAVLQTRRNLFVVARTDATDSDEAAQRASTYAAAGADAVLVEAVADLGFLQALSGRMACPLVFNQIAGGRSPAASLTELAAVGVRLVNYSTPCLFAAQEAIAAALEQLQRDDGRLPAPASGTAPLGACANLLEANRHGLPWPPSASA